MLASLSVHSAIMPANVANGSSVTEPRRSQIVHYLAARFSPWYIANKFHMGVNTVKAVRDAEWQRIEAKKPILQAQSERNAMLSGELMTAALENANPGDIPLNVLVPVFGVSVDKSLVLAGEADHIFRHEHFLRVGDDDLYGYALQRSKTAKAHVVEPPQLTNGDASHGETKARAKGRKAK